MLSLAHIRQHVTPLRIQLAIGLVAKGATAVISFVLNWLIAREFGARGVGLFSVAQTTALFGSTLALAGLEYVTVRQVATLLRSGATGEAKRLLFAALRQAMTLAAVLAAALFLLREPVAHGVLDQAAASPFLGVMSSLIMTVAAMKIASAALRASGQVLVSQLIDGPLGTGLTAAVFALFIVVGRAEGALTAAILYCAFSALGAAVGWLVLMRTVRGWQPAAGPRPPLLGMGLPILAIAISQLFIDWFALVVLTAAGDPAQTGLFRIAFQIVAVMNLLVVASDGILAPIIAQAYAAAERARIAVTLARTSAVLVLAASPLLLMCFIAPEWVLGLFGPEFVEAALALRILAAGQLVNLALGPIGGVLIMTHHERWSLGFGIASAVLSAGLCLWLVPLYGVTGAAIAVMVATQLRRIAAAVIVRFVVGIELWRWRAPVGNQQ